MKPFFDMSLLATLGFLAVLLLLGTALRARSTLLQKMLVPACLIGSLPGFILMNTTGLPGVDPKLCGPVAFHLFTLSFICLGLRGTSKVDKSRGGSMRELARGSLWASLIFQMSISSQLILATATVYVVNWLTGAQWFEAIGFLCAQGFTYGPGQAISTGVVWEQFGIPHMSQIGLSFAGMGFVVAFLFGIPLVNWGLRRKLNTFPVGDVAEEVKTGLLQKDRQPPACYQTTHPSSVDSMAFQVALVLGTWLVSYYLAEAVATRVSAGIGGTIWGLFFLVGMLVAMAVRLAMEKLGWLHLIDGDSMTRLTGWCVEFLLLSTIVGIQFAVIREYIWPLVTLSAVVGLYTIFFMLYFGRRISGYSFERTVLMFGTCTGTIPTGLLLLRMVDSELKTTVPVEAGMWNLGVFVFFYVNVLVHGFVVYKWGMPLTLAAYGATFIACAIALRVFKLWEQKQF